MFFSLDATENFRCLFFLSMEKIINRLSSVFNMSFFMNTHLRLSTIKKEKEKRKKKKKENSNSVLSFFLPFFLSFPFLSLNAFSLHIAPSLCTRRFVLAGFVHDMGKVLCLWDEPQYAVVGDTFPVGC